MAAALDLHLERVFPMAIMQYGMVGGGPGSFIGDAHRRAINLDGEAKLVAGRPARSWASRKTAAMPASRRWPRPRRPAPTASASWWW